MRQTPPPHRQPASTRRPGGNLRWISAELPGSTHDLTAARTHGITLAQAAELNLYADKGYQGAGAAVRTPVKGRDLIPALRRHNRRHARRRSPGKRGFATLKTWKIFSKIRCSPDSVGLLAQAVLALQLGLPERS